MYEDFITQSTELTPAEARQRSAQDTRHSIWVAASAGAGKTRVLTDRVVRLLLEGTKPANILALTYTRAAAKEMEGRVIAQARKLALAKNEKRVQAVQELLGLSADEPPAPEVLVRAQSLYEEILETPSGMNIHTLHAFCQSLLGRFPFEAGLTPGFRVVEDEERVTILAQAVAKTLETSMAYQTLQASSRADQLQDLAAALVKVDWQSIPADVRRAAFDRALGGGFAGSSVQEVEANFVAALDRQRGALKALQQQAIASSTKTDQKFAAVIARALEERRALETLGCAMMTEGRLKRQGIHTKALEGHPGLDWLLAEVPRATARLQGQRLYDLNAEVLAFGQEVAQIFAAEKRRRDVLDFDDLIEGARRIFAHDHGPTYVQYRLDQQISHILVDEAQDTSAEQWEIIRGLADPFFEDASSRTDRPRTLFVVGDFKQSIYSFQGAQPQLFADQRQHFDNLLQGDLRLVKMEHSFRSAPDILAFVDAVAAGAQGLGLQEAEVLRHQAVGQDIKGRVEVWPVPETPPQKVKPDWQPPCEPQGMDRPRAALGRVIAAYINRLCRDPAWAHQPEAHLSLGRRVQPEDFLILVENRRPVFANALISALKALNIPVTGVDRLKVAEELVVRDLLALGQVCLQPSDDLSLAALLKSPICGYDEDRLFALAYGRGEASVWDHLRTFDPSLFARLQDLARRVGRMSVYEFYATYLFAKGGRSHILAGSGPEADEVLSLFLDAARAHDLEFNGDLLGFIEAQRGSPRELKRSISEASGEVRIMTIHGAKGLEAPIVILPDLTDPVRSGRTHLSDQVVKTPNLGPIWVPAKGFDLGQTREAKEARREAAMAERERLFYVALTRARERLIICTDAQRKNQPKEGISTWYDRARTVVAQQGQGQNFELDVLGWPVSAGWAYGRLPDLPSGGTVSDQARSVRPLPDWARQGIVEPEPSPVQPLSPSSLLEEAASNAPVLPPSTRNLALRRGTLIHTALEHLPGTPAATWPERLKRFFAIKAPDVAEAERQTWVKEMLAALDDPKIQPFFGSDSQGEVTVSGQIDGRSYVGQIDRLHIDRVKRRIHILDYKTNRPPPERAQDVAPAYQAQLRTYAQLIAPVYPGFEVRTSLFWTHSCHLMDIRVL